MKIALFVIIALLIVGSCQKQYKPKPRGYFRIAFPDKSYGQLDMQLPYTFEIADYSQAMPDDGSSPQSGWINVVTKKNKADIHVTYVKLRDDLYKHIEESRKLAYDHSIKADAIEEQLFINPIEQVYGTIYFIEGNAASPLQFYLTDSSTHFIRGALYIREIPNIDSISPVIEFLEPDVIHLIETTRWTQPGSGNQAQGR